jgi:D-glycero-D-manno-heptose 1,7-bisphosphate phosphatase
MRRSQRAVADAWPAQASKAGSDPGRSWRASLVAPRTADDPAGPTETIASAEQAGPESRARIGHNQGPPWETASGWETFCWKKARREAWKTPPIEVVRRRCAMAWAVGLDYKRFTAVLLDRGSYLRVVVFDLGDTLLKTALGEIAIDPVGKVELLPGVADKLARLSAGLVFVVSNQSGVATGTLSAETAHSFIRQINDATGQAIDDYAMCFHHRDAGCACRKPRPGLVTQLLERHACAPASAFLVGDSETDRQCATAAKLGSFFWAWEYFSL